MYYAVVCLVLLILVCVGLLMQASPQLPPRERFADGGTGTNTTGSPSNATPSGADGTSSTPAATGPSTADVTAATATTIPKEANPSATVADVAKAVADAEAANAKAAAIPDSSSGSKSSPSGLDGDTDSKTSLCQGTAFTNTVAPYVNKIGLYKEAMALLKLENIKLQQQQPVQRCPDMSNYIRKDSIPCYNCSM